MKRIILIVIALFILLTSCSINPNKEEKSETDNSYFQSSELTSPEVIEKDKEIEIRPNISIINEDYHYGDKIENFDVAMVDYDISHSIENIKDNVEDNSKPIILNDTYTYRDLLYAGGCVMLFLGGDYAAWTYKLSGIWWGDTCKVLTYFTPEQTRFYNNKYYCIYEIEDYGRLYLYFSDINDFEFPVGYPMLVSQKFRLSDFDDIKAGDSIYKVIAADKVTEIYCAQFLMSTFTSESVYYLNEYGKTLCSLHYLDEGILRIEYDILDNGEYIVADKVLLENYQFTDYKGRLIDLSIMEEDLP